MTERPILFSASMVRAILEGRKTQTRRVIKEGVAPLWLESQPEGVSIKLSKTSHSWFPNEFEIDFRKEVAPLCPYGKPGDRLWCKETFKTYSESDTGYCAVKYAAGGDMEITSDMHVDPIVMPTERWKPSIHMPRWASRITLEITEVRVQRVQEISAADCFAEGACDNPNQPCPYGDADRTLFRELWDSINAKKYPWISNPWVWALTFQRVSQ